MLFRGEACSAKMMSLGAMSMLPVHRRTLCASYFKCFSVVGTITRKITKPFTLLKFLTHSLNGSFTLAKFVHENACNFVTRFRLPYLPWQLGSFLSRGRFIEQEAHA